MWTLLRRACLVVPLAALAALAFATTAGAADEQSRQCTKAQRRVAKEQTWAVRAESTSERDRKGRTSCATPEVCARYDARLREMDKRKVRHESRLAKLKADAAKACTSG